MVYTEQLPVMNAVGAEPPQSLKDAGWGGGDYPAAAHFNWFFHRAYKVLEELQQESASTEWVTQQLQALQIADASTTVKGVVMLDDATNSTSTTKAATANAVRKTYDRAETKLPLAGGDMTGAIYRRYSSSLKHYRNLAGYSYMGSSIGAIKILLPRGFLTTFTDMVIKGYDYGVGKGAWELRLAANAAASSGGSWVGVNTAILTGDAPFNVVTLGADGTTPCIILGGVTTTWSYTNVNIVEFVAANTGVDGWETGWNISLITDISGITKAVQPTLQKLATQAYADAAVATHNADYVRQPGYAATAGTGAAYTVTLNPAPAALVDGLAITIVPHADNTAADPTLKIGSLAALPIRRQNGTSFAAGSIKAGQPLSLIKVGSYFLARSAGATGTATAAQVRAGATFSNESNVDLVGTLPVRATSGLNISSNQTLLAGIYDGDINVAIPFNKRKTTYNLPPGSTFISPNYSVGVIVFRAAALGDLVIQVYNVQDGSIGNYGTYAGNLAYSSSSGSTSSGNRIMSGNGWLVNQTATTYQADVYER